MALQEYPQQHRSAVMWNTQEGVGRGSWVRGEEGEESVYSSGDAPSPPLTPTSMLGQQRFSQEPLTSGCHAKRLKQTVLPLRVNSMRSVRQRRTPQATSSSSPSSSSSLCTEDDTVQVWTIIISVSSSCKIGCQFDEYKVTCGI